MLVLRVRNCSYGRPGSVFRRGYSEGRTTSGQVSVQELPASESVAKYAAGNTVQPPQVMKPRKTRDEYSRETEVMFQMRKCGKTFAEIAAEFGLGPENVRVRIIRWSRNRYRSKYYLSSWRSISAKGIDAKRDM